MKLKFSLSIVLIGSIFCGCFWNNEDNSKIHIAKSGQKAEYKIIIKSNTVPGEINIAIVNQLPEPIKALAAFYAAMGGTNCTGEECGLTTALGLGKQGSDEHKSLIRKYFPDDKVAEAVLTQNCYLRPSGASAFSDFEYLTISIDGDSVMVSYKLLDYNHGTSSFTTGPDSYYYTDSIYKMVNRNLWKFIDHRPSTDISNLNKDKINTALSFINSYVANCNKINTATEVLEWVNKSDLVTNRFKEELKRIMDEAKKTEPDIGLEVDPLFANFGYPVRGYVFDSMNDDNNIITLTGKDEPQFKLLIKVVTINNQCLIDGCGIVNIKKQQN